jgi:hypothetical protein
MSERKTVTADFYPSLGIFTATVARARGHTRSPGVLEALDKLEGHVARMGFAKAHTSAQQFIWLRRMASGELASGGQG